MDDLISKEYMKKLGGTCIAARGTEGDLYPIAALDELPPVSCDKSYELWKESYEVLKEEYDSLTKCEDIISRQEAVDVLNRGLSKIPYVNNTDEEMIRRDERIGCIQEVAGLPSVQPRKGEWIDYSDEGYVECPFCHSATNCDGNKDELHYCFSCGAELR